MTTPTASVVHVAVGVIKKDNKILIAKRPKHVHQGGLWEFPGGKVEAGESVRQALARELKEELNIDVLSTEPLIKIEHDYGDKKVLLDTWSVTEFSNEPEGPVGREQQLLHWCSIKELSAFEFPKANRNIITAIVLPKAIMITGVWKTPEEFEWRLKRGLESGVQAIQLRAHHLTFFEYKKYFKQAQQLCQQFEAVLIANTTVDNFKILEQECGATALHLRFRELNNGAVNGRPVANNVLLSASCHTQSECEQAMSMGVDYLLLGAVNSTNSHLKEQRLLGFDGFEFLCEKVTVPAYAIGGMESVDISAVRQKGGQGVAAISAYWGA